MKKKIMIGALLFSVGLLAVGCGNKKEKVADEKSDVLQVSVDKSYVKYMEDIKADFEEENKVKVEIIERDNFDQLDALPLDGPAGKAPDVMMSPYDKLGPLYQQGHIAKYEGIDKSVYNETDISQVTVDNDIVASPSMIESLVLFYNKDLLPEAPKTFKDLKEIAKDPAYDFPSESGKNTGFLAMWTDFYFYYGLISGYDGYVFGDNGTNPQDIGLDSKGSIEGINYAKDWFQNIWPKGMQDSKSVGNFINDSFISEKTAAVINGPWVASSYKEAGVNYGVSAIPTLENGNPYQPFGGGKAWIISNYSKNQELGAKWLTFVTNEENQKNLFDTTNEIPANNKARSYASESNDELTKAVIDQYETSQPMPNIPEMGEIWSGAENLMFDAISGKKTAEESAKDSVKLIKESIDQKYSE